MRRSTARVCIVSLLALTGCASSAEDSPAVDAGGADTSTTSDSSTIDSTVDTADAPSDGDARSDDGDAASDSEGESAVDAPAESEVGGACSKGTCASSEICSLPAGACDKGVGTCVTKPSKGTCGAVPENPVCGCDGHDYTNVCFALLAGTAVASEGTCVPATCGNGTCDSAEDCTNCASDCGACGCGDGVCTKGVEDCSSCAADCCGATCTKSTDCAGDRFCDFAVGDCKITGAKGACTPSPTSCPPPGAGETVCGCDGSSYTSECVAASAGVPIAHAGLCP